MKRWMSLVLALVLVLGLCACGNNKPEGQQNEDPKKLEGLHAGFAQIDVTPEVGTPLGSYGNSMQRLSTGYSLPLMIGCIALTDGEDTLLLFSMDKGGGEEIFLDQAVPKIAEATGVPEDNIIMCSTHCHSAPDFDCYDKSLEAKKSMETWIAGSVEVAKAAMDDLAPAKVFGGDVETEKLAFVRHYKKADGTYVGDNFGDWKGALQDYATKADETMVLAKFDREEKADILLMNFQIHPTFEAGSEQTIVSSDAVGAVRTYIKEQTGMEVIYFTGDAGNQNKGSKLLADATGDDMYSWATKLGNYAINALPDLQDLSGDDIKINRQVYEGKVWKITDPETLSNARRVSELYAANGRDAGNVLAKELGFASVYHAGAVLGHVDAPDTMDLEMNAISIGNFALITAPYEMFSQQGIEIKSNPSFEVTAILGYADVYNGYIPDDEAYQYGCYESQTGWFEEGTAEILAEKYIAMLADLKK